MSANTAYIDSVGLMSPLETAYESVLSFSVNPGALHIMGWASVPIHIIRIPSISRNCARIKSAPGLDACGITLEVPIFHRWGALIYQSNNYQNNWNGFVQSSSVGGSNKVPTGTYYYIVDLKDSGFIPFAGVIYVGT